MSDLAHRGLTEVITFTKGGTTARRLEWGGGGREPFDVDYFHATPIGIMLNAAGGRSPILLPPPPPGAATHDIHILCTTRQRAGHEGMIPSNMTNDGTARAHLTEITGGLTEVRRSSQNSDGAHRGPTELTYV